MATAAECNFSPPHRIELVLKILNPSCEYNGKLPVITHDNSEIRALAWFFFFVMGCCFPCGAHIWAKQNVKLGIERAVQRVVNSPHITVFYVPSTPPRLLFSINPDAPAGRGSGLGEEFGVGGYNVARHDMGLPGYDSPDPATQDFYGGSGDPGVQTHLGPGRKGKSHYLLITSSLPPHYLAITGRMW